MTKSPYPNYPPCYKLVDKLGGMVRQCWVLEVCTDDGINPIRMAQLEDDIDMLLESRFPEVKASQVVRSDRFVTDLRIAMRTN